MVFAPREGREVVRAPTEMRRRHKGSARVLSARVLGCAVLQYMYSTGRCARGVRSAQELEQEVIAQTKGLYKKSPRHEPISGSKT